MKGFLSLLILLLALLASFKCEKLGELDLIDFEKIVSNKYLTEESTVFVAGKSFGFTFRYINATILDFFYNSKRARKDSRNTSDRVK